MAAVEDRQPVLVGVGQVNHRDGDAPEPVDLMAEAVRRAAYEAGAPSLVGRIMSIRVSNLLSRRYPDPARLVADRLGVDVAHTVYTTQGGQTPHQLVHRACDDIAAGRVDVVVVGGAESWRTRSRLKRRGERSPWSMQADDVRPSETFGDELVMSNPDEERLGLTDPVQAYPMFEQALRARQGRMLDEQLAIAGDLWSRLSAVAATNPYAALPTPLTATEVLRVGPDNRMIGFPYPKLLNSNSSVDQAAALIICAAEIARAVGVPLDRWVFLHGGGEGCDVQFLSQRHDLSTSPAVAAAGRAALDLAGIGIDDVGHVDLYSCFPSALQIGAEALGLGLDRSLTVTGGLTFAGGPWNNYVSHALATMAGVLRADPGSYGLVWGNGGFLTKHAVGVWSTTPPAHGTRWVSVQERLDAEVVRRVAVPHYAGSATVETFTVLHDGEGQPVRAWVFALTPEGSRTLAVSDDPQMLIAIEREDVLGQPAVADDGRLVSFG
jgi:acetyl-CoA C-acetyltransferase